MPPDQRNLRSQNRERTYSDYAGTPVLSLATTALYYPHAPIQKNQPRNRNQTPHHRHSRNPAQDQMSSATSPAPRPRTKHPLRHAPIPPPPPQNAPAPPHRNPSRPKRRINKPRRTSNPHVQSSSAPATHEETVPLQNPCRTRTSSRHILPPIREALTSLGFRPTFRYDKFRTTFRLPNLHLDLDETPAGTYLELEGAPKAIDRAAKALGFAKKDYLRATYWDLYVADCRRRGTNPKNMLFRAK